MNWNANDPINTDYTLTIGKSPMFKYCGKSPGIFKCPADKSRLLTKTGYKPRVRTISMNYWLGGFSGLPGLGSTEDTTFKIYKRLTDLQLQGESKTFVFTDVREDSIDTGNFATKMMGYPTVAGKGPDTSKYGFYDLPAFYHNRNGGFSFADGHSETKRWVDPRTMPTINRNLVDVRTSPGNLDVAYLQDISTRPIK
jgi:prepilin-type processing-associated H-X9-DG protein